MLDCSLDEEEDSNVEAGTLEAITSPKCVFRSLKLSSNRRLEASLFAFDGCDTFFRIMLIMSWTILGFLRSIICVRMGRCIFSEERTQTALTRVWCGWSHRRTRETMSSSFPNQRWLSFRYFGHCPNKRWHTWESFDACSKVFVSSFSLGNSSCVGSFRGFFSCIAFGTPPARCFNSFSLNA